MRRKILINNKEKYSFDYLWNVDNLVGFIYNNAKYFFVKNIQGDITHILNQDGEIVAKYIYDAFGNHKVLDSEGNIDTNQYSLGNLNPYRYRGYYFDSETGLYYLQSRYYDPELGRFISPDSVEYLDSSSINGLNLYCYCLNDPINMSDSNGNLPKWLQGLAIGLTVLGTILVIGAITALTMGVGTTILTTTMLGAVIHGAAVGTLIGAGIGTIAGGIIGGITTDWSIDGILTGIGIGFGAGALAGAIIGGASGAIQYTSAANSWYGGKEKMIDHFLNHGTKEGYKNVIQYTKSAKNIIKHGTYLSQKNAYLISKIAKQYYYVGVAKNSTLITTFFTKTFTKTALIALGII